MSVLVRSGTALVTGGLDIVAVIRFEPIMHIVWRGGILAKTMCGIEFDSTQDEFWHRPLDEVTCLDCLDCLATMAASKLAAEPP